LELAAGTGSLLRVGSGQTMYVDALTLKGHSANNASLVYISNWGTFYTGGIEGIMGSGGASSVTGNATTGNGGGVYVEGTFEMMKSFAASGNTAGGSGGGVYVASGGKLQMAQGTVYGSSAGANSNKDSGTGGALYVAAGGTAEYGEYIDVWTGPTSSHLEWQRAGDLVAPLPGGINDTIKLEVPNKPPVIRQFVVGIMLVDYNNGMQEKTVFKKGDHFYYGFLASDPEGDWKRMVHTVKVGGKEYDQSWDFTNEYIGGKNIGTNGGYNLGSSGTWEMTWYILDQAGNKSNVIKRTVTVN
jgi:hypothetical protein